MTSTQQPLAVGEAPPIKNKADTPPINAASGLISTSRSLATVCAPATVYLAPVATNPKTVDQQNAQQRPVGSVTVSAFPAA